MTKNEFLYNHFKIYVIYKRYLENYKYITEMITAIKPDRFKIEKKSDISYSEDHFIVKSRYSFQNDFLESSIFYGRNRLNTGRREVTKQWAKFMLSSRLKGTIIGS